LYGYVVFHQNYKFCPVGMTLSKVGEILFNLREYDLVSSSVWSSPRCRDGTLLSTVPMRNRSLQSIVIIIS